MKQNPFVLCLVLFTFAISSVGNVYAQIRRKPITPDLNPQTTPALSAPSNNTNLNNNAPVSIPPIIIKQENESKDIVIRKPEKGSITAEGLMQISFGEAPIMIKFPEIKGRYFATNKLAYRGTLGFTLNSQTLEFVDNKQTASYVISNQVITAGGGVEMHVKSSKRISPYYGAEGLILLNSQKISGTNTDDIKTYNLGAGYQRDSTYTGIYMGALAGLDYYLSSDIFIGFELGMGLSSYSTTLVGERKTMRGVLVSESNVVTGRGTGIGLRYSQGIRIGLKF